MAALKPQSNGPLYSNTVVGTLAVDGWAVTFGTEKRGLFGLRPNSVTSLTIASGPRRRRTCLSAL